jgi:lysophospholipase L1-like esterase
MGVRFAPDIRWPGRLAMITGATVIEEGLNGRTSVFSDPLLPWGSGADYIEACVCSHDPFDLLIVMLGTNDMKTHVCNSPDAVARGVLQLTMMARNALMRPDLDILVVAPVAFAEKALEIESTMLQLNEESIANSQKLREYLCMYAPLYGCHYLDANEYAQASDVDAVHLTPEGHAALADAIAAKVQEIFKDR